MTGNTNRSLNLDRPLSRDSINATFFPCRAPLVDCAPADTEQRSELCPGPCGLDRVADWVGVHVGKYGTDRSSRQDADSSASCDHAHSMDIKHSFARRLVDALDYNRVEPTDAARKRFLAKTLGITERHAGNYLRGEKLPASEGMVNLSILLGVSLDWLLTGRGLMLFLTEAETKHVADTRTLGEPDKEKVYRLSQVFLPPPPDNHKNAS